MRQPAQIVALLKAAGEITRLRLLCLLADGELSVKDFTEITGQSQPRISRHLKLLADANLVNRHAEGAWAYYRLADSGVAGDLAGWLRAHVDLQAPDLRRDREKLAAVRAARRAEADAWFADAAQSWDRLRSMHVPDSAVEEAILAGLATREIDLFLDLGTGTGRMLELLAGHYRQGVGVDTSREMLAVARAKLNAAGIGNAQVRLGDIADLSEHARSADVVMLHQVLHYFDDPGTALAAAADCLKPGGVLLAVDFAPHDFEFLRTEQAHRRLGLSTGQVEQWARPVGLKVAQTQTFPPQDGDGLTVCLWRLEQMK